MPRRFVVIILAGLLLSGCSMAVGRRFAGGGAPAGNTFRSGTELPPTSTPTEQPTNTPVPTPTLTPVPTPNPAAVGLPTEAAGSNAFDFVSQMCKAQWFTRSGDLPCPGDPARPDAGFVMSLPGDQQGLSPDFPVLLMYPPQDAYETVFSKYPELTIQKGDRFRAVLACRSHSFCDVEFSLNYYSSSGQGGIAKWPYIFTDQPIVVDYALDGFAGMKLQFGLSLRGIGNRIDAYGVWLMPHVYRPGS